MFRLSLLSLQLIPFLFSHTYMQVLGVVSVEDVPFFRVQLAQTQRHFHAVHIYLQQLDYATYIFLLTCRYTCLYVETRSLWSFIHLVVLGSCPDVISVQCIWHFSLFSDLCYVATTRFVGLHLFILFSGFYFCIYCCRGVSRSQGFMLALFSVRRIAISFSDHTRVF